MSHETTTKLLLIVLDKTRRKHHRDQQLPIMRIVGGNQLVIVTFLVQLEYSRLLEHPVHLIKGYKYQCELT